MPRGGTKGNKGRENPKIRSDNMAALLMIDKQAQLDNPDSPAVNKRNLKAMEKADKAEAVAKNLLNLAGVIDDEIGMLDRKALKNERAVDLDDTVAVMERSRDYFTACAAAGNPPSLLSFCSIGLGLTRSRVSEYALYRLDISLSLPAFHVIAKIIRVDFPVLGGCDKNNSSNLSSSKS